VGRIHTVLTRIIDVMLAFPRLLLALVVMTVIGPELRNAILAIAIADSPRFARVIRGVVLSVKEREYVDAARMVGASTPRILRHHVLPNSLSEIVIMATMRVAGAIRTEANLSFLGLGVPPPTPSWGAMISESRGFIYSAAWLMLFPGMAILIATLGFNLFGDGLRDYLDPRSRRLL
jgi:peptide/nickel transport system permease protein